MAPRLKAHDLSEANNMLKEARDLQLVIKFKKTCSTVRKIEVWTFRDASFISCSGRHYGETGVITGLMVRQHDGKQIYMYHLIDWASTKQRRVVHSSHGAEILACADAHDRFYSLRHSIRCITRNETIKRILHVDSKGLFDTISIFHD